MSESSAEGASETCQQGKNAAAGRAYRLPRARRHFQAAVPLRLPVSGAVGASEATAARGDGAPLRPARASAPAYSCTAPGRWHRTGSRPVEKGEGAPHWCTHLLHLPEGLPDRSAPWHRFTGGAVSVHHGWRDRRMRMHRTHSRIIMRARALISKECERRSKTLSYTRTGARTHKGKRYDRLRLDARRLLRG